MPPAGLLPKDLPSPPTYRKTNPADRPVMIYAVHSDALPIYRLDDYAYTILAQQLSTVTGRLGSSDLRTEAVCGARPGQPRRARRPRHRPGGRAQRACDGDRQPHRRGRSKARTRSSRSTPTTSSSTPHASGNIIVAYRNGAPVRLKDIGNVVNSVQNARIGAWFNNKPAEGMAIQRSAGANTVELVDHDQDAAAASRSIDPALGPCRPDFRPLAGRSRAAVHDVQFTMMLTIGLVIIVIFLFLRTLWATVIPSLAVPLSLLATFAVMYVVGYSLDNISLMALTISVGFVVDDAIVMIENIVRYIEQGERPFEAALKGAGQIGFTIISITFSLIAVFIPLLFMGGIIGRLFREFAVTVSVAVVASAFVSLTLTPVMCSLFLKEQGLHATGRLNRMAERFFDGCRERLRPRTALCLPPSVRRRCCRRSC